MNTPARPLADWLAAASDDDLALLFAARAVRTDVGWSDFFDAAEALLDPTSIARALPRLTHAEAYALYAAAAGADPGAQRAPLTSLALLRADGTPSPAVASAIAAHSAPSIPDVSAPPVADDAQEAHAAERAFTTISTVADLLLAARERPFTLLTGGAVSAGEKRHLGEAGIPADTVDAMITLALDAEVLAADERQLRPTVRSDEWLRAPAAARWIVLTQGFQRSMPRGVRSPSRGWLPPAAWPEAHPWDSSWPERQAELYERAQLLGLVTAAGSEPSWGAALRLGDEPDTTALTRHLPAEVDRIFLQNDLSAISPGALAPALDVRLRTMASRESAAQASSYRFSAESVAHAMVLGETADTILEFLDSISLTGIPQPLQYLVAQTAQRHGLVRVFTDGETGRTRIESADPHLLDAIAVDQSLRSLALTRHVAALTTRVGRDTVYWALTDARYPATLVDDKGSPTSGDRHPLAELPPSALPDYRPLIAALRSHHGSDADAAWLDRELEAAVRAKAVLQVTVNMPDGSTRELVLEATGLGGGRLRGRDRTADVERTLPVSSIRAATVIAQ